MKGALVVVLGLVAFVCAAKGHGRQVRLEREAHGVFEVTFGTGQNPAVVEQLWHRDRLRFWPTAALAAAAIGGAMFYAGLGGFSLAALLWGPIVAFTFAGTGSALALRAHDASAFARSLGGFALWFGLAWLLVAASLFALLRRA